MNQHSTPAATQKHSHPGWRRACYAGACGVMVCAFFAARLASGAWSEASFPIGEVVAQDAHDAMIKGLVRLHGADFTLYSGANIQSLSKGLDVNLEHGGTVSLCPRSELQVLSSHEQPGVLLAFQAGGAQSPFPMWANDVVMTPDWRIELKKAQDDGSPASLLLTMNSKGEVCFEGRARQASYFRVSQMAGDAAFNLEGTSMAQFANGTMQRITVACGCQVRPGDALTSAPVLISRSQPSTGIASSSAIGGMQHAEAVAPAVRADQEASSTPASQGPAKHRQRPQDVVGYVGAAIHFMFGR